MNLSTRGPAVLAAWVAVLLVSGCQSDAGERETTAWPKAASPVDTDGLIWAKGGTVHLPDGSTIDTGVELDAYVVAGPGVWFPSADEGTSPTLSLATAEGVVATNDDRPDARSFQVSSDGRWVTYINRSDGADGPAEFVAIDVTAGRDAVRTDEGLVPDGSDDADWRDLYEDAPVGVYGVVDDTAYVRGLTDLMVFDLDTGQARTEPLDEFAIAETDWYQELNPEVPLWNDDHTWQIPVQKFGAVPALESADGRRVRTSYESPEPLPGEVPQRWFLGGWLDDSTAVGLLTAGADSADPDGSIVLACPVSTGDCRAVEGTEEGVNLPSDRPFGLPSARSISVG